MTATRLEYQGSNTEETLETGEGRSIVRQESRPLIQISIRFQELYYLKTLLIVGSKAFVVFRAGVLRLLTLLKLISISS
jgi:hypothetical protein